MLNSIKAQIKLYIICALLLLCVPLCVNGADYDEKIAIVHTNDVHGFIDVEPYVKSLGDNLRKSGEYSLVLTVSAGDVFSGGNAVAHIYNGEFITAVMNNVYDIFVPGNNDLSIGLEQCMFLASLGKFKTLSANTFAETDMDMSDYLLHYNAKIGNPFFASLYSDVGITSENDLVPNALLPTAPAGARIFDSNCIYVTSVGSKVGFFGLAFNSNSAYEETINNEISSLKSNGCNAIVAVGHVGAPVSTPMVDNIFNLDAFIDAHSHTIVNGGYGITSASGVFLNQASCQGNAIGVMTLYLKDGVVCKKEGKLISDYSSITPDKDVLKLVNTAKARLYNDYEMPCTHTDVFLNGERSSSQNVGGSIRANETNLGDLICDAMRTMAQKKLGREIDVAIAPCTAIRASLPSGDISKLDILNLFQVDANATVTEMTAAQFAMRARSAISSLPDDGYGFMQLSGAKIEYTTYKNTAALVRVFIADKLIFDKGSYPLGADFTFSVITLGRGDGIFDGEYPMAEMLFTYLKNESYKIYPNTVSPNSRTIFVNTQGSVIAVCRISAGSAHISIQNETQKPFKTVVAAFYSRDETCLGVRVVNALGKNDFTVDSYEGAQSVRLFLWDDVSSMIPTFAPGVVAQ